MNPYSIPPFLTLVCFFSLGVLSLLRGSRTRVNILFRLLCVLGCLLNIDIVLIFNVKSAATALWISRIDHFFIVYTIPVYIHFFHAYLGIEKRRRLIQAAYGYAFVLMWFTPTPLMIESMQQHYFGYFGKGGMLYPLISAGAGFATLYSLVQIYLAIGTAENNARRNQLKYVFLGFGCMGLMSSINVLPLLGYAVYPPGNLSFLPLIVFAFGIFRHDLLDMGILLRKSLLYSILTASLTLLYTLIIITAEIILQRHHIADSVWFPILFFIFIAVVFGPLKTWVQSFIDHIFDRDKYNYRKTIRHVSRTIVAMLDYEDIARLLLNTIADAMKIDRGVLFLLESPKAGFIRYLFPYHPDVSGRTDDFCRESALIKYMQKQQRPVVRIRLTGDSDAAGMEDVLADMDTLDAQIALPMFFEQRLNGFIALGEKKSGDLYSREDLDLLETLAGQSALAIENARSYRRIEDLNKNLECRVTERTRDLKQALKEKERTQEQLIQSESLAAIGQLVAGAAHELNNPLTSVTSLVQTTIEDLEQWDPAMQPDVDMVEDLQFADRELRRARDIVASLLGLSRQTQTYAEAVNLNAVIKDALRVLHNQYKYQDIEIKEKYCIDLPDIQGNFSNLGQVALNIIKNAIQAVPLKKGKIILTTRIDPGRDQVVFECLDNGPGVAQNMRQDIFKPFFTTKEVGEGTGLGLYICHEIISKHGGSITLENRARQGGCFVVKLPIDRVPASP